MIKFKKRTTAVSPQFDFSEENPVFRETLKQQFLQEADILELSQDDLCTLNAAGKDVNAHDRTLS